MVVEGELMKSEGNHLDPKHFKVSGFDVMGQAVFLFGIFEIS